MNALLTGLSTGPKSLRPRGISCVQVALDVPLPLLFDYAAPEGIALSPGDRVTVPFGSRERIGVVIETQARSELPQARLKPISALREDAPRLSAQWLELMRFLSSYYQRPLGETVIASLPPRLRSVKPLPKKSLQSPPLSGARFIQHHAPTSAQLAANERMVSALGRFSAFLLDGVTGSG